VLSLDVLWLLAVCELALLVELDRVDDLVLLSDLALAGDAILVEVELSAIERLDDPSVEPHPFDLGGVGVTVGQVLGPVRAVGFGMLFVRAGIPIREKPCSSLLTVWDTCSPFAITVSSPSPGRARP
jgi:hypothetical protein